MLILQLTSRLQQMICFTILQLKNPCECQRAATQHLNEMVSRCMTPRMPPSGSPLQKAVVRTANVVDFQWQLMQITNISIDICIGEVALVVCIGLCIVFCIRSCACFHRTQDGKDATLLSLPCLITNKDGKFVLPLVPQMPAVKWHHTFLCFPQETRLELSIHQHCDWRGLLVSPTCCEL